MLAIYQKCGFDAALRAYGIKTAGAAAGAAAPTAPTAAPAAPPEPNMWNHGIDGIVHEFTGHPAVRDQLMKGQAFKPGGSMNVKEMLWPTQGGHVKNWMGRAFNGLTAYNAYKALKGEGGDPNEGRLTNALSGLGGTAGFMLGQGPGGFIGGSLASAVGSRLGRGLGRVLGSSAE